MDYYFIGDAELLTAFRFIGIDGTAVHNETEAAEIFKQITEGKKFPDCNILILTEEISVWLKDILVNWELSGQYPIIAEIPGIMGRIPGKKKLTEAIREAIGIHV